MKPAGLGPRLDRREVLDFCRKLIRTRSYSGEEGAAAGIIRGKMEELGYDEVFTDALGNVIGRISSGGSQGKKIIFNAHMDTANVGDLKNWKTDPLGASISKGKIWGRGASDMKAALACMVYGAASVNRENLAGDIYVACVVHEETHEGLGISKVIEKVGKPDFVILGEATNLQLAIGQRGRAVFELKTHGKTAHASMPYLGDNAVYRMLPVIGKIRKMKLPSDRILGKETIALTSISCKPGEGPIIPDECTALVDWRMLVGRTSSKLLRELRKAAGPGAEVKLQEEELVCYTGRKEKVKNFFPGWLLSPDEPLVKKSQEAITQATGKKPKLIAWQFSTDGAYTCGELGILTVGFGPAEERFAHTPKDNVPVAHLEKATRAYSLIAENLLMR